MIDKTTTASSTSIFQLNSSPAAARSVGFAASSGMPPNSVPLGQRYLQNHGSPIPVMPVTVIGRRMTNSPSTTNLSQRSTRCPGRFFFF